MTDPKQILQSSKTILLVDWPNTSVPRTLLEAGFIVFGYSPYHYSMAEIVLNLPKDIDANSIFPPKNETEKGYLVFRRLDNQPQSIDIVSVYRPAGELPAILSDLVLPLDAKVVWLQRPMASVEEKNMVEKYNLVFIEGDDMTVTARALERHT